MRLISYLCTQVSNYKITVMRKLLFLALLPMLFASCGSDGDDEVTTPPDQRTQLVIGNWQVTEVWKVWTGLGYSYEDHWEKVYGDLTLSIKSGGSCSVSGDSKEKYTDSFSGAVMEFSVDFPKFSNWEWNSANTTTPLRLYNSSTNINFEVTFISNNNLQLKSGDIGYKFMRLQ